LPHPLDSARERLKRAKENIRQLNAEIDEFLAPVPVVTFTAYENVKPVFTEQDRKAFEELINFIKTRIVKPRFSVLAGEIIHHLRSSFDHLVWQLSSPDFQAKPAARKIEFPVFLKRPKPCSITKDKMSAYCRKVEGISSPSALARIEWLQPYTRPNPSRNSLWIIHDMDISDKHRELILAVYSMNVNLRAETQLLGFGEQMPWELNPRNFRIYGKSPVQVKGKMSAQITFREFSGREDEPIIPMLNKLLDFTTNTIESFAEEFG